MDWRRGGKPQKFPPLIINGAINLFLVKATVDLDGTPMLFRPEKNAARLNFSADRMGMPSFPEDLATKSSIKATLTEINFE